MARTRWFLFREAPSRLAARAARTFSSYSNVLRDKSNVLRSGMADGSSRLDHHAVLLGVPLLLIGSGALLTTLGRTVTRAPAESSSAAAADPLTEIDSDEDGLQVSGGSLEDVYEVGEVLGRGHFAVVTSGRHRVTGETVAIKTIRKGSTNVRSEVEILRRVGSHPNIVALKDVFETEREWLIVMELVTGGDPTHTSLVPGCHPHVCQAAVCQAAVCQAATLRSARRAVRAAGAARGLLGERGVCTHAAPRSSEAPPLAEP